MTIGLDLQDQAMREAAQEARDDWAPPRNEMKDKIAQAEHVLMRTVYKKEQEATGATGVKYDIGKPEFGLIPPHAMLEMVKVLTAGAQKYSRDNWIKVPGSKRRYFDAMERHIWAWKRGELYDQDDGIHHLAHAACCLFFLYEIDVIYNGGVPDGEDK